MVTPNGIIHGSLSAQGGLIDDMGSPSSIPGVLDFEGDYLLPGLVEIHTDNIEKHFLRAPECAGRPASPPSWPMTRTWSGRDHHGPRRGQRGRIQRQTHAPRNLRLHPGSLAQAGRNGLLRAEHLLHIRCELADRAVVEMFSSVMDHELLRLVSIMDHTPGQRNGATWKNTALFTPTRNGPTRNSWPRSTVCGQYKPAMPSQTGQRS
jgi:Metal-dependent hydrolase involved in phosphonate metabolism